MKIKSVAAVGAIGVGIGLASFIGGTGTASAEPCGEVPIGITPGNIICNVQSNAQTFADSISPARNLGILFNGTEDNPELGLVNQLNGSTFTQSVQSFLSGPKAPNGPDQPAAPGTPPP